MRLLGTILLVVTLVIALSATPVTAGENFTFVATSGTWDDQFSWEDEFNQNGVPDEEDTATVPTGRTCTVDTEEFAKTLTIAGTVIVDGDVLTIGGQTTGKSNVLNIQSGGTLTVDLGGVVEVQNDCDIEGDVVVDDGGTLEIGEGSLESGGSITVLDGGEVNCHVVLVDFSMEGDMEIQDGGVVTITAADEYEDSDFAVIGSLDVQSGGSLVVNITSGGDEFDLHNDVNVDGTIDFVNGFLRISADVAINGTGTVYGGAGINGAYTLTIGEDATLYGFGKATNYGFENNGTVYIADGQSELLGSVVYGSGTWHINSLLRSDSATIPVFSTPGDPGTWIIDGANAWWHFAGVTDSTFSDSLIWNSGKFSMRDYLEDHTFQNCGYFEIGGDESNDMDIELLEGQIVQLIGTCPE